MKSKIIKLDTYIITLNKSYDDFKEYNILKPQIIKGVNGKLLCKEKNKLDLSNFNNPFLTKSIMGCALSHIKCWKRHKLNNNTYSLILEDDFFIEDKSLLDNLNKLIKFFISQTPIDFDILYLGSISGKLIETCFKLLGKTNDRTYINKFIYKPLISLGLHSYIISDRGSINLLNNIKQNKIKFHLDYYIQSLSSKKLINTYITKPRLFYQTSTYNSISLNTNNVKFPFFYDYYIDKYVSLNYLLNVNIGQIFEFNISVWFLLFIIFIFLNIIIKKYIKKLIII